MSTLLGSPRLGNNNAPKDATGSLDSGDVQIFISADRRKSCVGTIRRVSTGSMELVVPIFISPSQTVQMIYSGCDIEARVLRCSEVGANHVITVRLLRCAGTEMRGDPRVPVHIDAILQTFGNAGKFPIRIVDISQAGLGVVLPINLAVGQQVAVDLGQGIAMTEVRYCRVTKDGNRAGLQVLEFFDREVPVSVSNAGTKDEASPGLSGVMSLIRSKRSDFIVPEPDKS